jgi:integrase
MSVQKSPQENPKNCKVPAKSQEKKARPSRASVAYWRDRVFQGKTKQGALCANYGAMICFRGRREYFNLHTPNKDAAAEKAVKMFRFLGDHGWEATLIKFKPEKVTNPDNLPFTVGALIEAATSLSSARQQSKGEYAKAFRRIVSEIEGIDGKGRYDAKNGGNEKWKKRVDGIPLARITPDKVQSWKNRFLEAGGEDAVARRNRVSTFNGLLSNAKALYSRKFIHFLRERVALPATLPFEGITKEKGPSLRYRSKINAEEIMVKAREELATAYPDAFKIILLAGVCGLRRSEIDYLLWDAFNFTSRELHIENSEFHQLKSEDSAGVLDLDDNLTAIFRGFHAKAKGTFVIESDGATKRKSGSGSYRCEAHWKTVIDWLKKQGVTAQKPVHELRKEIGSLIASEHGIYAASRYLRHSDIRITAQYYLDKKQRITPALSASFSLEKKIVEFAQEQETVADKTA